MKWGWTLFTSSGCSCCTRGPAPSLKQAWTAVGMGVWCSFSASLWSRPEGQELQVRPQGMRLHHDRLSAWLRGEVTSYFNIKFVHLVDLTFHAWEFPRGWARQARAGLSCCISRSRIQRSTLCLFPSFWEGCLSSLLETTKPSLLLWGTATASYSNMESGSGRAPREWQQALLHQAVGHVLAVWPSEEAQDRLSLGAGKHGVAQCLLRWEKVLMEAIICQMKYRRITWWYDWELRNVSRSISQTAAKHLTKN